MALQRLSLNQLRSDAWYPVNGFQGLPHWKGFLVIRIIRSKRLTKPFCVLLEPSIFVSYPGHTVATSSIWPKTSPSPSPANHLSSYLLPSPLAASWPPAISRLRSTGEAWYNRQSSAASTYETRYSDGRRVAGPILRVISSRTTRFELNHFSKSWHTPCTQ